MNKKDAQVVIRRVKKVQGGGHHGGAWKVAYADFVTAMMAFFLVMWLVGSTTNKEKAAVSEYFKNPSAFKGHSMSPAAGPNGPGGASTSMIKLGGSMEIPHETSKKDGDDPKTGKKSQADDEKARAAAAEAAAREMEKQKLESLMDEMKAAIEKSQALAPFKDQLLIDITPLGLRIQIVDKQNRPMFDMGSAAPKSYTIDILHELAKYLNEVPNRISISGHTDITPYASKAGYSNWDLSTDRANAARRTLMEGGMQEQRIGLVVGLASSALFDKKNPTNPINRRISIVVMNRDAERAELGEDSTPLPGATGPAPPGGNASAANASPPSGAGPAPAAATPTATAPTAAQATAAPAAGVPASSGAARPTSTTAASPPAAGPPPAATNSQGPQAQGAQTQSASIPRIVPIPSLAAAAAQRAAASANAAAPPPPATGRPPAAAKPAAPAPTH